MDVYVKGIDIPYGQSFNRLFDNLRVECQIRNWLDLPLRVKAVDDDMTPRQPRE